jgi:hypothetical protein
MIGLWRMADCHPDRKHHCKGLCEACYHRSRRRARGIGPRAYRRLDPIPLFWAKVEKGEGCWLWRGVIKPNGYGGWRSTQAHRAAWLYSGGVIPLGMQLDHLCRVRSCVRPDHLEVVTPGENSRRGILHNRTKTHCPSGHAYEGDNIRWIQGKWRACRACDAVRKGRVA